TYEVHNADVLADGRWRCDHRDERAAWFYDRNRPGEHFTANGVEDEIDLPDNILPPALLEVDEAVGARYQHNRFHATPAGADNVSANRPSELHRGQPQGSTGSVNHHCLPGSQMAVVEQRLPGRQPGLGDGGSMHVVDGSGFRRHIARLDGDVFSGCTVTISVDEAEDLVTNGNTGSAVAEGGDDAGKFVSRDNVFALMACAIRPERPVQLGGGDTAGVHLHQDIS